jgi:DNA-binding LacI/PurR family transcriptional regulator
MTITIKDIARKAGVSHATVSRALNNHPCIPEKTAVLIRDIAAELGYLPSAAARGLKTRHSQALGVLVNRIDNPYFGEILQGIEDTVKGAGYSIFVASSFMDRTQETNIIRAFSEHRVDGVIIGSVPVNPESFKLLDSHGIPVVVINNQSMRNHKYAITHDDVDGARQVARHLISLGHRRIAFLGNARAPRINRNRLRGLREELKTVGVELVSDDVTEQPGGEIENGAAGMRDLYHRQREFSAVFCFNDLLAIGALHALNEMGIRVPEDVSITGFDNIQYSAYTSPTLTTFDQPKRSIGAEAARMLMELISAPPSEDRGNHPYTKSMRGQLLVRKSTARIRKE